MVDIADSKWTEEDEGNTAPSPDGIQRGYAPSTNAPIVRAIRGAVKRQFNRINAMYTSTGNGVDYAVSPVVALPVYTKGERIAFFANAANTGPVTLNISGLGAKTVLRSDGAPLTPNEIKAGGFVEVVYNGTAFNVVGYSQPTNVSVVGDLTAGGKITAASFVGNGSALTALDASKIATGTIDDARLPATMTGKTFSGPITVTGDTTASGKVTATSADLKGNLNIYPTAAGDITALALRRADGSERGVVYAMNDGTIRFRMNGNTANEVYINTDGNIWSPRFSAWGSSWVFDAVNSRIESRASAFANERVYKNGDTMTGQLRLEAANLQMTRGGGVRYLHMDSDSIGFLNNGGGWSFRSDNAGNTFTSNNLYAAGTVNVANGNAIIHTDGNIQGPLYGGYLSNWVEGRCAAHQNAAVDRVMQKISEQGAGGVGTYAFLQYDAGGANPGDQVWGGSCRWSDRDIGSPQVGYGSWRAMGWSQGARNSTLFMRYA